MADITASRINNLQSSIELILGSGSGENGYGQSVSSAPVNNTDDTVDATDMNNLYADILTARIHQVGPGDSSIAQVIQNENIVAENTSSYYLDQVDVVGNRPAGASEDPDGFKKGIIAFETLMTQVQTDKALLDDSQSTLEPAISSARTSTWNGLIYHEVAVTFSSADARRFFFNAGGELRISANNTSASTAKGLDWTTLCSEVGTVKFSATSTTSVGGSGSAIGNYGLTPGFKTIYQKIGSGTNQGVYAGNIYTVKARSDIATRIIFRIEFNDVAQVGNIDNNVDGRLESTLQHKRATGTVVIQAPSYYNSQTLA